MRLLAAAHALALSDEAPGLATAYASCGPPDPTPDPRRLADAVALAATEHPALVTDYLDRPVQTNEPGRASAIMLGLSALAAQVAPGGPDIVLVEIGSSAGLNLRLDRFAYADESGPIGGDPASPVRLTPDWPAGAPTLNRWRVGERWGLDPHPMDPLDDTTALRLRSYLWPDQRTRRARLDAALELAKAVPARVTQTDDTAAALDQLLDTLAGASPTLVFHSIVWQYVPRTARTAITRAIEEAGARATTRAPLMRLSFEPDPLRGDRVAVDLRSWPGGSGRLLAHADFHGRWVRTLPR